MKTTNLFTAGAFAMSMFLVSCGGGGETASADNAANTPEPAAPAAPAAETINIDLASSNVAWKGEMLGVYAHEGLVDFTEGSLEMTGNDITGGHFVVDMTSMRATDENYPDGKKPADLIGHLSTNEFFNTAEYPTAMFDLESIENGTGTGTLTVRGKTGEETIENVQISNEGGKTMMTGTLTFNRQNYDVSFQHPAEDLTLSDDIELVVTLVKG